MVRTVQITGIAAGRTTPLSLGAFLGPVRVGVLTRARILHRHSTAISMHALAAHSHALSGHALAAHSHNMFAAIASTVAFDPSQALVLSAGTLRISGATGGVPDTTADLAGTPAGGIDGVSGGVATGAAVDAAMSMWAYTIDSSGRYVAEATHPAARHAVLKPPGAAGPRVEFGDVIVAPDIIEITLLMQANSGGIFQ